MSEAVSLLAPAGFPALPPIAGVGLATHGAGIRGTKRVDLFLAAVAEGTAVAATFTPITVPFGAG